MKKLSAILMMVIAMVMATPNSFAQSKDQKKAEKLIKKGCQNLQSRGLAGGSRKSLDGDATERVLHKSS